MHEYRMNAPYRKHNARTLHGKRAILAPSNSEEDERWAHIPHDAPPPEITPDNPAGTDGFEFVEFAHPEPEKLEELFAKHRLQHLSPRHQAPRHITVWRQGDINYVLNAEARLASPWSSSAVHGPCAPPRWPGASSMPKHAFRTRRLARRRRPMKATTRTLDCARHQVGIGGSASSTSSIEIRRQGLTL
jgi:4-hydroxyphenylpyruvate dioxygenase